MTRDHPPINTPLVVLVRLVSNTAATDGDCPHITRYNYHLVLGRRKTVKYFLRWLCWFHGPGLIMECRRLAFIVVPSLFAWEAGKHLGYLIAKGMGL